MGDHPDGTISMRKTQTTPERCGWNEDADGVWESDCGASFVFTEGGSLDEHEFRFCHSCGKRIEEVRYGVERDEEKA